MLTLKRVYICDHCGTVSLEKTYYLFKGAPDGWIKLGKEDLCPICAKTYERFKNEVKKEKAK